ncbi:MAG: lytic transglycosylase domain-containing protein [Candidatus Velthaea sp.]
MNTPRHNAALMVRMVVPRVIATLCSFLCLAAPAFAHESPRNPIASYAGVLRVINPHMPDWQSRKYAASILANAQRTHVDPRFIMAIVTVESHWRADAVSRVGARGLGQLMPRTASGLRVNARDASENLRGTAKYLQALLNRFHGQDNATVKAIAGYNAGPNAVTRFGGVPPYGETRHYVTKVLRVFDQLNARVGVAWSPYAAHRRSFARRVVPAADSRRCGARCGTGIRARADRGFSQQLLGTPLRRRARCARRDRGVRR